MKNTHAWKSLVVLLLMTSPTVFATEEESQLWTGGTALDPEHELVPRLREARLIYVGEEHGEPAHHLLQRDILAALSREGPTALACEYFPRSLQPVLDRFNRGEIPFEEFPQAVGWDEVWGHPFSAYEPLFRLCFERRIPVVALNAEREFAKRVRREGFASLEVEELLSLPPIDLQVAAHRTRVLAHLQRVHPLPPAQLERYYQSFTLWDEVMADSVRDIFLRDQRPDLRVLVVAGRAHISTGTGIPDRVSSKLPLSRLIVLCDTSGTAADDSADLFFSPARRPPQGGKWY